MTAPARPRLAEALAAVTDARPDFWARYTSIGFGHHNLVHGEVLVNRERLQTVTRKLAITDPREAWEALAARGVIPMAWVGDARRGFACEPHATYGHAQAMGCPRCDGAGVIAYPPTIAACVALASDPRGVETAEAIAREACGPRKDVVWRVVAADEHDKLARQMCEYGGIPPASTVRWTGAMLALGYAVADYDRARIVLAAPAL